MPHKTAASSPKLLRLSEAAHLIPRHPSASTIWRWATRGVRGRRLESTVIGGFRYTTADAVQGFLIHCNESVAIPHDDAESLLSVDGI